MKGKRKRPLVFRPRRLTLKPKVAGIMNGQVDGAGSGRFAEMDAQGQYRLKLPSDLGTREPGKGSRLARKLQAYTGSGYGIHFPDHIGAEALLAYVNGDPDRPIFLGSAPNPKNASPVCGANAPQCIIKTAGDNQMILDDAVGMISIQTPTANTKVTMGAAPPEGREGINMFTDSDYNLVVKGFGTEKFEKERIAEVDIYDELTVNGDQKLSVEGDQDIYLDKTQRLSIKGDQRTLIKGNQQIHVVGSRKVTVCQKEETTWLDNVVSFVSGISMSGFAGATTSLFMGLKSSIHAGQKVDIFKGRAVSTFFGDHVSAFKGIKCTVMQGDEIKKGQDKDEFRKEVKLKCTKYDMDSASFIDFNTTKGDWRCRMEAGGIFLGKGTHGTPGLFIEDNVIELAFSKKPVLKVSKDGAHIEVGGEDFEVSSKGIEAKKGCKIARSAFRTKG